MSRIYMLFACRKAELFEEVGADVVRMAELQLKDNVALIVLLRPRTGTGARGRKTPCIVVANTHLLFNPKRGDIKAWPPWTGYLPSSEI